MRNRGRGVAGKVLAFGILERYSLVHVSVMPNVTAVSFYGSQLRNPVGDLLFTRTNSRAMTASCSADTGI